MLLNNFSEDNLERERETRLIDVFFEHQGLVLTFTNLIWILLGFFDWNEGAFLIRLIFIDFVHNCFKFNKVEMKIENVFNGLINKVQ